jgi:hypothetical protein
VRQASIPLKGGSSGYVESLSPLSEAASTMRRLSYCSTALSQWSGSVGTSLAMLF